MRKFLGFIMLLAGVLVSVPAMAGHYHHHSGVRFGVFIGPPVFGPWWWYPPAPVYYDPPVVYRQPVVVAAPPTNVVVQPAPTYSAPAPQQPNNEVIELGPAPGAQPRQMPPASNSQSPAPVTAPQAQSQQLAKQVYVYPRQGQSAQQQAQDEAECNRWASGQMGTGFDAGQAAAGYQRALAACLDAHGYSVR